MNTESTGLPELIAESRRLAADLEGHGGDAIATRESLLRNADRLEWALAEFQKIT